MTRARPRSMVAALQFRLLGPVTLADAEGREAHALLAQPRRLALLAFLAAASPRGLQRRDVILTLFWPELDQEHARAALRQALRVIRGSLGAVVLSRGDDEIGLDFDRVECDVEAFDRAIAAGRWEDALSVYRGPLLDGFFISEAPEFERWVEKERARLRSAAVKSARGLVACATEDGDTAGAAEWARRGLRLAPLDEGLMQQLIGTLDRLGDRAGAVQAYDDFARRLSQELEVQPSAETQDLLAAVRARVQPSPRAVLPEADSLPRMTAVSSKRRLLAKHVSLLAAAVLVLLVGFSVRGQRGPSRPPIPPSRNAEAYDLYLRASMLVNQRQNRENDSVAITLFERIVALDPSFAAAQAGLARAYALRVSEFAPGDTAALQRAQEAAEKALRLDPNLAEAHQAQARLLWGPSNHFFHERAIREDQRALSLDSNMDRAHQHLGNIYLHIGMLDEAIVELQKALAISPREDNALRRIAEARAYQGHYDDALRLLSQVDPEANPPYWYYETAVVLLHLGRSDSAFALIRSYLQTHPEDRGGVVTSARAVSFALAGDARRAEADIQTAVQKGKGFIHFHHAAYHIALAYALLHRPDSAVRWLRTTADGGMPCYPLFKNDPFLDNVRNDPGFVAFLREQKAQWERWRATL